MRTNDIKINGNVIGGRQGWAYICNSMKFAVLKADMEKEHEYDDYRVFEKVRVVYSHRGSESLSEAQLEVEKGEWFIGSWGCCIKSSFGFHDMMKSIEQANSPIIREGDVVAIALYSDKIEFASLSLFKVGKVDINCQVVARLNPLTDEEMQKVKDDADRWCNRW